MTGDTMQVVVLLAINLVILALGAVAALVLYWKGRKADRKRPKSTTACSAPGSRCSEAGQSGEDLLGETHRDCAGGEETTVGNR
jgi:hypothetical protein